VLLNLRVFFRWLEWKKNHDTFNTLPIFFFYLKILKIFIVTKIRFLVGAYGISTFSVKTVRTKHNNSNFKFGITHFSFQLDFVCYIFLIQQFFKLQKLNLFSKEYFIVLFYYVYILYICNFIGLIKKISFEPKLTTSY
jgi:hypothetical protein